MGTPTNTTPMMAFEGDIFFSSPTSETLSKTDMTWGENVADLKLPEPSFGEVEHTLKKHRGQKSYIKGMVDWVLTFTISKEYVLQEDGTRTMPADVQMVLDAVRSRSPLRIMLSDWEQGAGPYGIFEVWGTESEGAGEAAQTVSCTAKPYAGAGPIKFQQNGEEVDLV